MFRPTSFTFLLFTAVTLWALTRSGLQILVPAFLIFVGVPIFDLWVGFHKHNPDATEAALWSRVAAWAPAPSFYFLTHFAVLIFAGLQVRQAGIFHAALIGITVGVYTGGIGVTVAHELAHRRQKLAKFAADVLMASVCYQHFTLEHIYGHHLHVSTPQDPASARRNEVYYLFYLRTVRDSYLHAWQIQRKLLKGSFFSFQNRMLLGHAASLAMLVAAFLFFGMNGVLVFILQSIVAFSILETVNYIEHYGLERKQLHNGRYEKIRHQHSWNSAFRFSNALFFNIQRHSDHHADINAPFTILKHAEEAPQLPLSYPGMILIAVVPPLWFRVMNPRLDHWTRSAAEL